MQKRDATKTVAGSHEKSAKERRKKRLPSRRKPPENEAAAFSCSPEILLLTRMNSVSYPARPA
jgi:hypothetical protein